MARGEIRSVAIRTAAMVVVFLFGAFCTRVGQMIDEDRYYDRREARLEAMRRAPPGPPMRASAEDCAMFRQIATRHYRAKDMPTPTVLPRARLLGGPDFYGSVTTLPGLSPSQARSIGEQAWRVSGDYVIACDWRGAGVIVSAGLFEPGAEKL